jgi:hypothetical protein
MIRLSRLLGTPPRPEMMSATAAGLTPKGRATPYGARSEMSVQAAAFVPPTPPRNRSLGRKWRRLTLRGRTTLDCCLVGALLSASIGRT